MPKQGSRNSARGNNRAEVCKVRSPSTSLLTQFAEFFANSDGDPGASSKICNNAEEPPDVSTEAHPMKRVAALRRSPELESVKVAVHKDICEILCLWCGSGIHVGGVISHLNRVHNLKGLHPDIEKAAESLLKSLPTGSRVPSKELGISKELEKPIEGLQHIDGWDCLICRSVTGSNYACASRQTMLRHVRLAHSEYNHSKYPSPFEKRKIQSVFGGSERRYFAVEDPEEPCAAPDQRDLISAVREAVKNAGQAEVEEFNEREKRNDDKGCVDYFLTLTGWDAASDSIDAATAEKYTKKPNKDCRAEQALSHQCEALLELAKRYATVSASYTLLRNIGCEGEGSTNGRKAFRPVQEAKTIKRYSTVLACLVMTAIRRGRDEVFSCMPNIPPDILSAGRQMWSSLRNLTRPEAPSSMNGTCEKNLRLLLGRIYYVCLDDSANRMDHFVSQFLMLSNRSATHGWLGAERAGHIVAALQYVCRSLILVDIQTKKLKTAQCKRLYGYLSTADNTSFGALQEVMNMASTAHAAEARVSPTVIWSTAHRPWSTLAVGSEILSVAAFKKGIVRLVEKMESIFTKDVLLGLEVPTERWNAAVSCMSDDMRCSRKGLGIASSSLNPKLACMRSLLTDHICSSPSLRRRFFDNDGWGEDGKLSWNYFAAQSWCESVNRFVDVLITVVHILSGGPARAEELATASIINTEYGSRNVYWACGQLMLMLRYHKSQNMFGSSRPIPRFLPKKKIAMVALQYIAIAKPLEVLFAGILYSDGGAQECHAQFMFAQRGKRVSGEHIRRSFAIQMRWALGIRITFREYRHVQNALCKAYVKHQYAQKLLAEDKSQSIGSVLPLDMQAGHSAATGEHIYGVSNLDHKNATYGELLAYWLAGNGWSSFCGYGVDDSEWSSAPANRSAGTEDLAIPIRNPVLESSKASLVASEPRGEERVDQDVQRFEDVAGRKRRRSIGSSEYSARDANEILEAFRKYSQDTTASFRSTDQMNAILEVCKGKDDLLVVMPTGSGKTLIYMLPAWLDSRDHRSQKTTVVIVPLVSLIIEIKARCLSQGISVGEWKCGGSQPNVLLVSVEAAATHDFMAHLSKLAAVSKLARIVIEEAHTVVTWSDFRPTMSKLGAIRPALEAPLVLLTATLPPSLENRLSIALSSPFRVIRADTSRPNLRYSVIFAGDLYGRNNAAQRVHAEAVRVLERFRARLRESDARAIVYCPTRKECIKSANAIAPMMNVVYYHGGLDRMERAEAEAKWRDGTCKVITATSAFGMGIDNQGVTLTLHLGHSGSLIDYAQETGRCGRDGRQGDCITIVEKDYSTRMLGLAAEDRSFSVIGSDVQHISSCHSLSSKRHGSGVTEFLEFVGSSDLSQQGCRRKLLQIYLDGIGKTCLEMGPGCTNCDICNRFGSGARESKKSHFLYDDDPSSPPEDHSQKSIQPDTPGCRVPLPLLIRSSREEGDYSDRHGGIQVCELASKLRERPSPALEIAASVSLARRNVPINATDKARVMCTALKGVCCFCVVATGKRASHELHKCKSMRGRCLRCFCKGHSSRNCSVSREECRADNPACYECGFAHENPWGASCKTGLGITRDIAFAIWEVQKGWMTAQFPMTSRLSSIQERLDYLYGRDQEFDQVRVLQICELWWEKHCKL